MTTQELLGTQNSAVPSRKEIWRLFNKIAPCYDLLNHILSCGQDFGWRRKLASHLKKQKDQHILDLATGTADVLITICQQSKRIKSAVGIDLAPKMLALGQNKIIKQKLEEVITLLPGDAMQIPFPENSFDAVTIAFGIRNVPDTAKTIQEMLRVLKPGGRVVVLEFSLPQNKIIRKLYLCYFRYILPWLGFLISGNHAAYRYLNQTVEHFPYGQAFCDLLTSAGFEQVYARVMTFGIATIYQADKPERKK